MKKKLFTQELEEFLNAWGLLELAMYRTKEIFSEDELKYMPEHSLTLWEAFQWFRTPEGHEVWSEIQDMFSAFCEDK